MDEEAVESVSPHVAPPPPPFPDGGGEIAAASPLPPHLELPVVDRNNWSRGEERGDVVDLDMVFL